MQPNFKSRMAEEELCDIQKMKGQMCNMEKKTNITNYWLNIVFSTQNN